MRFARSRFAPANEARASEHFTRFAIGPTISSKRASSSCDSTKLAAIARAPANDAPRRSDRKNVA
jgi:hypothetical protein